MVDTIGGSGLGSTKTSSGSTPWLTCLFFPAYFGWSSIINMSRGITASQCGLLDALVCYALYPFFYNPFLVRTSRSPTSTLD